MFLMMGGWYDWQNILNPNVEVSSGEQFLKIQIMQAGFNIARILFESLVSIVDELVITQDFQFGNPYPNPFNPSVNLSLNVMEKREHIGFIHCLNGSLVKELNYGILESGSYELQWDGSNQYGIPVHSGLYIFQLIGDKTNQCKKLLLVR